MDVGLLLMGSHPPERSKLDSHRWDLDVIRLGDELGYVEAWIGEHFAALWEPLPTADYLIVQALTCTRNIKLGAGVYLLPFHHPVDLAHRISYLDHLAQGRLLVGIGSGGLPVDGDYLLTVHQSATASLHNSSIFSIKTPLRSLPWRIALRLAFLLTSWIAEPTSTNKCIDVLGILTNATRL